MVYFAICLGQNTRFANLVKEEFYDKVQKRYGSLDELRTDLDAWLKHRMTKVAAGIGEGGRKSALMLFNEGINTITSG